MSPRGAVLRGDSAPHPGLVVRTNPRLVEAPASGRPGPLGRAGAWGLESTLRRELGVGSSHGLQVPACPAAGAPSRGAGYHSWLGSVLLVERLALGEAALAGLAPASGGLCGPQKGSTTFRALSGAGERAGVSGVSEERPGRQVPGALGTWGQLSLWDYIWWMTKRKFRVLKNSSSFPSGDGRMTE